MKSLLSTLLLLVSLSPTLLAQTAHQPPRPATPALSPQATEAFERGTAALQAGRPGEAVAAFQQVVHDAPRFPEAYLNLGLALSALARYPEAIPAFEHALAIKPSLRGAGLFLAIAHDRTGQVEAAATAIHRETAAFPSEAPAWMWQGIIDLDLGRLTLAIDDLDRAATLDSKNVDILYHRGRAALALSRQSYETMFHLDPHSWHVAQVLAEADVESGNDTDAVEQFKAAIAAAPPQGGLYEALGSALWRLGKFDEAQQAYETGLNVDPNDTLTMYKLGCLRVTRSDAARGKPLLEHVLAADPSLAETTYYLGRAESELGNDQAAIADFKQSIAENRDDETTRLSWFQLSRAYRRLHDIPASNAAQTQFRLLDQQHRDTLQARIAKIRSQAGRDTSIPAPAPDPDSGATPDPAQSPSN